MGLLKVTLLLDKMEEGKRRHCANVANVAKYLVHKLNLSEEFAYMSGLVHDIGYAVNTANPGAEGYKILMENRLNDMADISIIAPCQIECNDEETKIFGTLKRSEELVPYYAIIGIADYLVDEKGNICKPIDRYKAISASLTDEKKRDLAFEQYNEVKEWLERHKIDSVVSCLNLV